MFPSISLTPPKDAHEFVDALYPSYWLLSVLNLIEPFSTTPDGGLSLIVPEGIVIALTESILATLPVAGVNLISKFAAEEILLFEITRLSLTLRLLKVLKVPVVVISPDVEDITIGDVDPIAISPFNWSVPDVVTVIVFPLIELTDSELETILDNVDVPEEFNVGNVPVGAVIETALSVPDSISETITSVWTTESTLISNPDPKTFGLFKSIVIVDSSLSSPPSS